MDKNALFTRMDERIEKGEFLNQNEIYQLPEPQLKFLLEYFQEKTKELSKQLASQENLNSNLIRISKERKTQESGKKCKENGFEIEKITEMIYYSHRKNSRLKLDRCYKLRIKTPYDTDAFSILAAKRQYKKDFEQVTQLTGELELLDILKAESILYGNPNKIIKNFYWDEQWEADCTAKKRCWYITFLCLYAPFEN